MFSKIVFWEYTFAAIFTVHTHMQKHLPNSLSEQEICIQLSEVLFLAFF